MGSHLTKKDYKFFEMARKVAENSTYKQFHIGAIIVYKGNVVSTGYNSRKTHPIQKKYNRKYRYFNDSDKPIEDMLHAEISSLVNIPYCVDQNIDYSQAKIYIYRICPGKRLKMGLCRPCPACFAALRDKGFKKVYYTTDDGFCMEELYQENKWFLYI